MSVSFHWDCNMRGPFTSNSLELIYFGEFNGDASADTVRDMALKTNSNLITLDETISAVTVLKTNMDILQAKGHVAGLINGGVSGAPEVIEP